MAYGFEVFYERALSAIQTPVWPLWPKRHYPTLGYHANLSRDDINSILNLFQANLLRQLLLSYPDFHHRLKQVQIHNNGYFSYYKEGNNVDKLNSMHIEMYRLEPEQTTILDHYANYITSLFGAIVQDNTSLPEIRDFAVLKTSRNRLFQLYVMCETIASSLFNKMPALTGQQIDLYHLLFKQLRVQNPSEYIHELPIDRVKVTQEENMIINELIFPRIQEISTVMRDNDMVKLTATPYFNGGRLLEAEIPRKYLHKIMNYVKKTYEQFPDVVNHYYQQQTIDSRTPKLG